MIFRGASQEVVIRRVGGEEAFAELRETWNALLDESSSRSFFLSWEWLWTWWRVYKEDNHELCILLVFRGDRLIGIAPFYVVHRIWRNFYAIRSLYFLGTKEKSVTSEYMDVLYRPEDGETVIGSIIEFIGSNDVCDDMRLHKIEASSSTIRYLQNGTRALRMLFLETSRVESPYCILPPSIDEFVSRLGHSMQNRIRRNQQRIKKYRKSAVRKTDDISGLDEDFLELVRLHQQRWESRNMPGSFSGGKFTAFQKMVMSDMIKKGNLELWFLTVNGNTIAALYGIRYKNKICYYQGGIDASFDRGLAPGLLLHYYCIENAIREGIQEYDFLLMGSSDGYKKEWTTDSRYLCDLYLARPWVLKTAAILHKKAKELVHPVY